MTSDDDTLPLVAQVIALGNGAYQANLLPGFDRRVEAVAVLTGNMADSGLVLSAQTGSTRGEARLTQEAFTGTLTGARQGTFTLKKAERLSPTLGKAAPEGAVVLFDGSNTDAWFHQSSAEACKWMIEEGAMTVSPKSGTLLSRQVFKGDHQIHLEFRTPFQPDKRGQGRGNSGVYVQGMYEVQVLDSYGLEGLDNECGGIYKVGPPLVNMCAPPMQWQTYDIDFAAPTFDAAGVKTSNARLTVRHNGVLIHEDREAPNPTAANSSNDERKPNGLHLQDHGNPVSFRNIWVVER